MDRVKTETKASTEQRLKELEIQVTIFCAPC